MQFTREPIIETIITPKEGYKLVVRNSKGSGHEEFFVDAVQVVTVGSGCFYRSLEKPKPFLVPASDYEVIETKEAKMVLKIPQGEKGGIKIGGGRGAQMKAPRSEPREEEVTSQVEEEEVVEEAPSQQEAPPQQQSRKEKRRMRKGRRHERFEPRAEGEKESAPPSEPKGPAYIIPPPSTLISETIARYKEIPGFASAFFEKEEGKEGVVSEEAIIVESSPEEDLDV